MKRLLERPYSKNPPLPWNFLLGTLYSKSLKFNVIVKCVFIIKVNCIIIMENWNLDQNENIDIFNQNFGH